MLLTNQLTDLGLTLGTETALQKLLNYPEWNAIPIGKLWGWADLALIPGKGALPTTEKDDVTNLKYAATDSAAIYYADGHPSEFDPPYTETESLRRRRLRRFASLGWVIYTRDDGTWEKTGHALVIDMEEGRNHRPWLVLASHWPVNQEDSRGSFIVHAPEKVERNDSTTYGVLPGGHNRTPVARIDCTNENVPILQQFGSNFIFQAVRFGGSQIYNRHTNSGPDLPHIMDWYWDPVAEQEVCYGRDGTEYMRFNRQTKKIDYPSLKSLSTTTAGEVGFFGIMIHPQRKIELEERLTGLSLHEGHHKQEVSATEVD